MENFDWDAFVEESKKYKACAGLWIDKENARIELLLDTTAATYSEWIPGEGADISLLRCHKSRKVIGVNLPLYQTDFSIFHTDGIRVKINEGFLKEEKKMTVVWLGWDISNLFYYGTRFNSGVPYKFVRIGPLMFKKYL